MPGGKIDCRQNHRKGHYPRFSIKGVEAERTFSLRVLGDNLFLIEFEYEREKERVLEGRPWVFEGNLFSVEDFDGVTPPAEIDFENAAFWVCMYNLPLACMGLEVGKQIGSTIGLVEAVETDDEGVGWGKYLRVRIKFDLTKPVQRGRVINVQGKSI
jgi:hypothetical protein